MKELAVISGKGGTGKTSLVASFASLAENVVVADCDVDAADLHLVLEPNIINTEDFSGGSKASIISEKCVDCGKCQKLCRFGAIYHDGPGNEKVEKTFRVDQIACEGCGVCAYFCEEKAIKFAPVVNGKWFLSDTRYGPMVHAKLGTAEENSGKLVSLVRNQAKKVTNDKNLNRIIIDGSPGIGCPVIASITGVNMVLVVTEPTLSGLHDLERVAALTKHFGIQTVVCINKYDLNDEITKKIESEVKSKGLEIVGKIKYDRRITEAQIKKMSLVEFTDNDTAQEIRNIWANIDNKLSEE